MDIEKKLDDALDFIANSRAELTEGKVVVMEGFQHEVREICEYLAALPVGEMVKYSPKLEEISANLSQLEAELVQQKDSIQSEIISLSHKQKALNAYQTAHHSDNKDGNS